MRGQSAMLLPSPQQVDPTNFAQISSELSSKDHDLLYNERLTKFLCH
jgi:hypothetical protein